MIEIWLSLPAGRALISDWSVNSFITDVYEKKILLVVLWTENSAKLKKILIENHYKTIY